MSQIVLGIGSARGACLGSFEEKVDLMGREFGRPGWSDISSGA